MRGALALLLVVACQHRPAVSPDVQQQPAATSGGASGREVIAPGDRWTGGGLCLDVPRDWDALGRGDGVLGTLHHAESGVDVFVLEYDVSEPPIQDRDGFTLEFEDQSAYRSVPALSAGGTRTWTSEEPDGPTLKEWYGTVGNQRIHLEVVLPFGRAIEGTRVVEVLLASLKTTC